MEPATHQDEWTGALQLKTEQLAMEAAVLQTLCGGE